MAIREKKYKCGEYLEVELYHISKKEQKKSRKRKKKESRKEQKNLNDKNARKKLRRILNANFTKKDLFVHLTYDNKNLPTNEDMYYAYKLIMNDKKIKYCANSVVYHSHNFTLKQLYDRYKLTGRFFKENTFINNFGTTSSGGGMAKYVLKRILKDKRIDLLIRYPFDMAARFIGMRVGEK